MNTLYRRRLLVGTGFLIVLGGVTYSCKDFLETEPQGTLRSTSLTTRVGVEGSLIAAYRVLDCSNATNSNWVPVTAAVTAGHSYTLTLTSKDDNYFADPEIGRFPGVTEDEPPVARLVSDCGSGEATSSAR